jgi:hypothetical protein
MFTVSILVSVLCCPTHAQQTQADDDPAYQKYVIALPAVDKVEVLAVTGFPPSEWKNVDCTNPDIICNLPNRMPVRILASKTLSGEGANRISMLWRNLRRGNGAGCFAPGYVLRFYQQDKLLLATEVCFHCCNITLPDEGIASMCGSEQSLTRFKEFVTTELPFPKLEGKK